MNNNDNPIKRQRKKRRPLSGRARMRRLRQAMNAKLKSCAEAEANEPSTLVESSISTTASSVLNPASKLIRQPMRLPDGTLMVPLPIIEHVPIKQEIVDDEDEDIKPVLPLYSAEFDEQDTFCQADGNDGLAEDPMETPPPPPPPPRSVHMPYYLEGHRIVNMNYVVGWMMDVKLEHFKKCPETDLKIIDEVREGFNSNFVLHCDRCGYEVLKSTMNPSRASALSRAFCDWRNSLQKDVLACLGRFFQLFSIPYGGKFR